LSPLLAAPSQETSTSNDAVSTSAHAAIAPAEKCLGDVKTFNDQMSKQGYWLGGSGYGYGYPMGFFGYGYGYGMLGGQSTDYDANYGTTRPGYEIRTLIAAATILAQTGQEQPCQTVLATGRSIYDRYATNLNSRGFPRIDQVSWRQRQIAAAKPVATNDMSFRSDQLLDTDVINREDEALGSVHDLVMNPKNGMIAYLIVARGGIFGIDASYVPVPWADFKVAPGASFLVLDNTKAAMNAAPQVSDQQFTKPGQFDQQSQTVNAYWALHGNAAQVAH
jgi:sporulation protein YlmC with PRC-barrel domain